jgi:D-alanyl-D-alanine dipeptidase
MKAMLRLPVCPPACLAVCLAALLAQPATAHGKTKPLQSSTQILLVTTPDWNAVDGAMQRYARSRPGQRWKAVGEPVAIVVGKSGLAWGLGVSPTDAAGVRRADDPVKREGDGKSPAGVFRIGTAFGYAAAPLPGWKMPYLPLTESIECVDDPASKFYNRIVDRTTVAPDWNSSEHMRDTGEYYRWGLAVEHNADPATPGGGSCIFLHIWGGTGKGTTGCTAMEGSEVEALLAWLDPNRHPLLVQLPAAEYEKLRGKWKLPKPSKPVSNHTGDV